MRRNARRREAKGYRPLAYAAPAAFAGVVARNPLLFGGAAAFAITLSFVSANAIWYQPHFDHHAFFATRSAKRPAPAPKKHERRDPIARAIIHMGNVPQPSPTRPGASAAEPRQAAQGSGPSAAPDPTVKEVQSALHELKFYEGPIDGLTGPLTRKAIADYQAHARLSATGTVDYSLLKSLKIAQLPRAVAAAPAPRPHIDPAATQSVPETSLDKGQIIRVQAGLKAFGSQDLDLDGVVGPDTEAAVKDFQSLFGLKATGVPDEALLAKMRELGLVN